MTQDFYQSIGVAAIFFAILVGLGIMRALMGVGRWLEGGSCDCADDEDDTEPKKPA